MSIKVLSWNIWGGQHLPEIIDFLSTANADIIGLQEVTQNTDGTNNLAQIIAEKLGYEWFFAPSYQTEASRIYEVMYGSDSQKIIELGNAVLSKYKITDPKNHILSEPKRRTAVEATIRVTDKTTLHVFSTHLKHTHQKPSELQDLQTENILKIVPKENALVMGDFNAIPESNCIKLVESALENMGKDPSLNTWSVYPEGCPVCKPQAIDTQLDYIFRSRDVKASSFTVHTTKGSDHLPVSVMVEV